MEMRPYRVDPRMVPPVVLAIVFGAILLILEGPTKRGFLLFFLLSPFFYLAAEILARRIVIDSQGVTISKFLRSTCVQWSEITSVDAVKSGSKLFLILNTDQHRPVLITNTIRPFNEVAQRILENIPQDKISSGVRELVSEVPPKFGPLVQAWIICLVLLGVIIGKLMGYGN
ncbi:MAG: PH domain-containing protein [Desulfomonile tiedjei]|uniref:PH domain-containing protein n=1 Tax=Desulfomonile tiedjei TaxID=2358 RepID=A0A9D6V4L9_9BACT|nr:PH domain-containing protein [Desulfomonile tiedjei]